MNAAGDRVASSRWRWKAEMTKAMRALLQRSLLAGYNDFVMRLSLRLGSKDLVQEALHEIWLRLERSEDIEKTISNPDAYLYRAALNTAANLRKARNRRLSVAEFDELLEIADDAPGPERIAEGHADMERLEKALAELPLRQRSVFTQALLENISYEDLAKRHGVSVRTVHNDVRHAIEHCALRLGKSMPFNYSRSRFSR